MKSTRKIIAITLLCFIAKSLILLNFGARLLCLVFSMTLSSMSISEGRKVTTVITPRITPFAMTRPISLPSVKLMKHSARKPKTVVSELPIRERKVESIAAAMASFFVSWCFFSSSNLSIRKTE